MDHTDYKSRLSAIDRQLAALFEERLELCRLTAASKISTGSPVHDGEGEEGQLKALEALAANDGDRKAVGELFTQILAISRRTQYEVFAEHGRRCHQGFQKVDALPAGAVRVVYQGVEGSYGHAAALQYFGQEAKVYPVLTFENAMREVQEGWADYGVLPIENSSAGAVADNYDLLVKYHNYMVAETFLPVNHALLAGQDATLEGIRTVYSHPQALMQSSDFLNAHKDWKQVSLVNTAVAAKKVLEDNDPTQAAVASEIAGRLYGLKTLAASIQNNRSNTTRFMILTSRPIYRQDAAKVSICFELPHHSGSLYNMLGHFIVNGVNMVRIESRPIPGRNWEYRFFIDLEGSLQDPGLGNALDGIAAEAGNLRIFGNY